MPAVIGEERNEMVESYRALGGRPPRGSGLGLSDNGTARTGVVSRVPASDIFLCTQVL